MRCTRSVLVPWTNAKRSAIPKGDPLEQVFELDSYARGVYNCGMLANSETAGCQLPGFTSATPWRSVATPLLHRTAMPAKLAMKDTLIASAFLCAYMALYLAVGFVGLSAVEWVWTYVTN